MNPSDKGPAELPGGEAVVSLPRGPVERLGGVGGAPAGRLGDKAMNPGDAHGCPACPHPAVGPAISGSPSVLINGRPALRVSDKGVHAACCGSNRWEAGAGTPRVLINGLPAHRMNDMTAHCGGRGQLIEGSPNVLFGGDSMSGLGLQGALQMLKAKSRQVRR